MLTPFGHASQSDTTPSLDVQNTFVLTLLLLEAGGNFSDEGRHVLFSATSSLMTFVLMVRRFARQFYPLNSRAVGSICVWGSLHIGCLHPGQQQSACTLCCK